MLQQSLLGAAVLGLAVNLAAPHAEAAPRVNSKSHNCLDLKRTIIAHGAAILRFSGKRNKSIKRFDRFVSTNAYCQRGEIAEWSMAPAKDTRQCRLLTCQRFDPSNYEFGAPYRRLRIK